MLLNILFILALTFPVAVASTAFGVNNEQSTINNLQIGRKLMFAVILALGQGVMYILGSLLGETFMHLLTNISKWMVFALCFSIFYRMLMSTLKIKNGSNLFFIETKKQIILLSVALGVNSFIAGLMTEFYLPFQNLTPYLLMATAFIWAIASMAVPFSKMKLTLNSFLNLVFAFMILAKGFSGILEF